MNNQEITEIIKNLIDLTYCTAPADDLVEEAREQGEELISYLQGVSDE